MAIELNHTIVPALDKEASATFFARIFGLRYEGPTGHFAPFKSMTLSPWTLTMRRRSRVTIWRSRSATTSLMRSSPVSRPRAFRMAAAYTLDDMQTNTWGGGRGVYFKDPNGHVLELLTAG